MLLISYGPVGPPAARVLAHVRRAGVVMREDIVSATGLSPATVSRVVGQLLDAGLLRQRPDMGRSGVVGRPSIPLQLAHDAHGVIGVHLGRLKTTVCLADLRGRVIADREFPTPKVLDFVVDTVKEVAGELLARSPLMNPLAVGLVAPWRDLGHHPSEVGPLLGRAFSRDVTTADHITAAASAEHATGHVGRIGQTVYVYARDTIGFVTASETEESLAISAASRLTHFPTGSERVCRCRATGCLEATASDEAVCARAEAEGLIETADVHSLYEAASHGSKGADAILGERAGVLARAAAFVSDMVDADRVVLIGQAFTAYEPAREQTLASFRAAATRSTIDVGFGRFGAELQAVAASTVALRPVFDNPLACIQQARRSQTSIPV